MPNWCCNEERITGPREEILPLHKKLLEWTSRNYMENGFGHLWLGNIVLGAGFKVDGNGKNYLHCRGALLEEPMLYDDEAPLHLLFLRNCVGAIGCDVAKDTGTPCIKLSLHFPSGGMRHGLLCDQRRGRNLLPRGFPH